MEIERKFLVTRSPPDLERYPHQRVAQGYLIRRARTSTCAYGPATATTY